MFTHQKKVGGFVVRGIELVVLTPDSAELARENGEKVYDLIADAQDAVCAALRGVCDNMHIPTSMIL
jgi:hypothetical protein